ncbi:hypothetical protein SLS58_002843 [Diplodia intermedia]|uniref:JmjC domain-containing protein n=1 Tax=Diplodia intermedia TaxID=856260 RepID=A0ABR3TXS9_9PEZI
MKRETSVHSNARSSVSAQLAEGAWEHYMNIGKRSRKEPGNIGIAGHPTRSEEGGTIDHGQPTNPKRGRPKGSKKKTPTEEFEGARTIPPTEQNPEPKRKRGRPKGSKNKRPASAVNDCQIGSPSSKRPRNNSRVQLVSLSSAATNQSWELAQTVGQLERPELDVQPRQDAESGQSGNRSPAEDEKKELNRLSQEYLRKFRKVLDKGGSEWGEYSTEFRYPPKGEALYRFLKELDGMAEYAHTWSDEVLRRARTRDQYGGRLNQWTWEKVLKEDFARETDVISVDSMDDLKKALAGEFRKPIFHRARRDSTGETIYSLVDSGGFDLERFLADRKEFHANDHIDVHDMSEENTIRTKMKTLFDAFEPTSNVRPPQNFLSLENLTQHTFCPEAIAEHNLRTRIEKTSTHAAAAAAAAAASGKRVAATASPPSTSPEFFIASTANTISPIHIDSGGGNTWISILSGRKLWYFPRRVDESTVRLLESADNLHAADHRSGWAKLELRAGDLLVMPPAFPHAVFTPDPSLAVGGQFYTAPHLPRACRAVVQQRNMWRVSNERLGEEQYEGLAALFGPGVDAVLAAGERRRVSAELLHVLQDVPEWEEWVWQQRGGGGRGQGDGDDDDDDDSDVEAGADHEGRDDADGEDAGGDYEASDEGEFVDDDDDDSDDGDYKGSRRQPMLAASRKPVTTRPRRKSGKPSLLAKEVGANNTSRAAKAKKTGAGAASISSVSGRKQRYKCSLPKSEVQFVRAMRDFRLRNPL